MRAFCYSVATAVLLAWTGFMLASFVRAIRIANKVDPGWAAQDATFEYVLSAFGMAAFLTSWILAVYVWSRVPRSGAIHVCALVFLILLGFFWSAFYILASARLLPSGPKQSADASVA
jgi:hypothetical protein